MNRSMRQQPACTLRSAPRSKALLLDYADSPIQARAHMRASASRRVGHPRSRECTARQQGCVSFFACHRTQGTTHLNMWGTPRSGVPHVAERSEATPSRPLSAFSQFERVLFQFQRVQQDAKPHECWFYAELQLRFQRGSSYVSGGALPELQLRFQRGSSYVSSGVHNGAF